MLQNWREEDWSAIDFFLCDNLAPSGFDQMDRVFISSLSHDPSDEPRRALLFLVTKRFGGNPIGTDLRRLARMCHLISPRKELFSQPGRSF